MLALAYLCGTMAAALLAVTVGTIAARAAAATGERRRKSERTDERFTLVCLGALVGAPARYLMDRAIQARHQTVFPWGTMLVNIIGSFALGALAGLSTVHVVPSSVMLLIATGVCGAFTTYSAFAYETLRLIENRRGVHALAMSPPASQLGSAQR